MNIIKAIGTLVFIFIASVANSKTEAGEEVRSSYQLYTNIMHSGSKKYERFNKGEYVIENEGQCENTKEASLECSILNLDKTIENRKKNNELNIWSEVSCIYRFNELPDNALEKVEIESIHHYEYEGNYYIRVFQDRYYKNTDKIFSFDLILQVTEEGGNKSYHPKRAIREIMEGVMKVSCTPTVLDSRGYRTKQNIQNKQLYRNIMARVGKMFKKGEYVIENEGQCENTKEASFECSLLNLDKTLENRKKNNEPNIWDEAMSCHKRGFKKLPDVALEKIEIFDIYRHEHEGDNYIKVIHNRYYKNLDIAFPVELILQATEEGDNISYQVKHGERGMLVPATCHLLVIDSNGYRLD